MRPWAKDVVEIIGQRLNVGHLLHTLKIFFTNESEFCLWRRNVSGKTKAQSTI